MNCNRCKENKPESAMRKDKGRYYVCKACHNERRRCLYANNPERTLKQNSAWARANRDALNKYTRIWRMRLGQNYRTAKRKNEINGLADTYVRQLLAGGVVKHGDVPKCLVDAHRELLKLKRELRNAQR